MKNTSLMIAIILIVVAILMLGSVGMTGFRWFGVMWPGMMEGHGMGGYHGHGVTSMGVILSLISWLLTIIGIVFFVSWFIRSAGGTGRAPNSDSVIEILKARYARGEIIKEQFDAMKRDLRE